MMRAAAVTVMNGVAAVGLARSHAMPSCMHGVVRPGAACGSTGLSVCCCPSHMVAWPGWMVLVLLRLLAVMQHSVEP
jgi:hypothetical protein